MVYNQDGTICQPPQNPLLEKWKEEYTPMRNGKLCTPMFEPKDKETISMAITCLLCREEACPYSRCFKVPEEDMQAYQEYKKAYTAYLRQHNLNMKGLPNKGV